MRCIYKTCLYFFTILGCAGCASQNSSVHRYAQAISQGKEMQRVSGEYIEIDTRKAEKMGLYDLYERVLSMDFLPLSSTEIIGELTGMHIYKDRIYILDRITEKIFIFDRSGALIKAINGKGRGPKEYLGIRVITIDPFVDELLVPDRLAAVTLHYDLEGNFLRKSARVTCEAIMALDTNLVLLSMGYGQSFDSQISYGLVSLKTDSVAVEYRAFPHNDLQKKFAIPNSRDILTKNVYGDIFYTPRASDTVYQILSDSTYRVRYGIKTSRSFWEAQPDAPFTSLDEYFDLMDDNGYSLYGGDLLESEEYLHFSLEMIDNRHYYFYDKRLHQAYEKVVSSQDTTIMQQSRRITVTPPNPIALDGKRFVGSIEPGLVLGIQAMVKKDPSFYFHDPRFLKIVENFEQDGNPVLVFYELK